jgi:putative component of membrane protein insertase Oxa1/YidC/SpoIIIJ protein YidD
MRFKIVYLLIVGNTLFADPWGKDADLIKQKPRKQQERVDHIGINISTILIRFHQEVISPIDGPRSHFRPSSSQYTLDAIQKYGFLKGFFMGSDRLLRENDDPWLYPKMQDEKNDVFKWDPVR